MKSIPLVYSTRISFLGPLLIAVILITGLSMEWFTERYPLSHAHWDNPIYLNGAKRYGEEDYLTKLRYHSRSIYDCLMQGNYLCAQEGIGYWSFARLGHTISVGTLVSLTGTDEQSIYILTWAYRLMFAVGLFFAAILAVDLIRSLHPDIPEQALYLGASLSLAFYLLSDIASYMSGNLVSEVPAILFLSISIWLLIKSWSQQSPLLAIASGVSAFVLFVVRMETITIYLTFFATAALMLLTSQLKGKEKWKLLFIAGLTAFILFLIYSWIFYPLTDPRVVLNFRSAASAFHHPDAALKAVTGIENYGPLIAANPILWIGAVLSLPLIRSRKVASFGLIWLLFSIFIIGTGATTTEIRRLTPYILPLFVLSTIGWSNMVFRVSQGRSKKKLVMVVCLCAILVLVSQPASYSLLRTIPGMWRLQYIRQYLASRTFERIDYHLPELFLINRFLNELDQPFLLVVSPKMQVADHYLILTYLYNPAQEGGSKNKQDGTDREDVYSSRLRVYLSDGNPEDFQLVKSTSGNRRLFLISMSMEQEWLEKFSQIGKIKEALVTKNFSLVEINVRHEPLAHSVYTKRPIRTDVRNGIE